MLANAVLVISTGLFMGTTYFLRKQNLFRSIFEEVRKAKSFHMDYVEDVAHLPLNKSLILFGPAHSFQKETFISPSYIQKENSKDRLWHYALKQNFYLETASKQRVMVESTNQVLAFNLPQTSRELKDPKYEERAIINNVGVCCYGKLLNKSDLSVFKPKMIIGNKHESLLVYLDKHIMDLNKKGKACGGLGLALILAHGVSLYYSKSRKRGGGVIEKEISQFDVKK